MRLIRLNLILLLILSWASAAWADDSKITTYYPSPYGLYGNVDTNSTTSFATSATFQSNTTFVAGGGKMVIGTALANLASPSTFNVYQQAAGSAVAAFRDSATGYGILVGGPSRVEAFHSGFPGTSVPLVLNGSGGSVGVGLQPNNIYAVEALNSIGITRGGQKGNLRVSYINGDYYATYAP